MSVFKIFSLNEEEIQELRKQQTETLKRKLS